MWILLFSMVMCNLYRCSTIDIVMYVKVYGKEVNVVHNNMRRKGRHDNNCRDHVFQNLKVDANVMRVVIVWGQWLDALRPCMWFDDCYMAVGGGIRKWIMGNG